MSPCSVLMESEVEHLSQASNAAGIDAAQSLAGTEAYEALPQLPKRSLLPFRFRRTIRRHELRPHSSLWLMPKQTML